MKRTDSDDRIEIDALFEMAKVIPPLLPLLYQKIGQEDCLWLESFETVRMEPGCDFHKC